MSRLHKLQVSAAKEPIDDEAVFELWKMHRPLTSQSGDIVVCYGSSVSPILNNDLPANSTNVSRWKRLFVVDGNKRLHPIVRVDGVYTASRTFNATDVSTATLKMWSNLFSRLRVWTTTSENEEAGSESTIVLAEVHSDKLMPIVS
jgi:hypothetical protein